MPLLWFLLILMLWDKSAMYSALRGGASAASANQITIFAIIFLWNYIMINIENENSDQNQQKIRFYEVAHSFQHHTFIISRFSQ